MKSYVSLVTVPLPSGSYILKAFNSTLSSSVPFKFDKISLILENKVFLILSNDYIFYLLLKRSPYKPNMTVKLIGA